LTAVDQRRLSFKGSPVLGLPKERLEYRL